MKRTSLVLPNELDDTLNRLKDELCTKNIAYIVRLAVLNLDKKFLGKNVDIATLETPAVPALPGMTERIVRSQMIRWDLTADEYNTIVRQTIDEYAANGQAMKNPEAAIFGACRRYADGKNGGKNAVRPQPQPAAAEAPAEHIPSIAELQEMMM